MSNSETIYGTTVLLPNQPSVENIDGFDLPRSEQKWQRKSLPSFFEKVEYNKNGDLILNAEQEIYAKREVRRCKEGIWIYINNTVRYIPPKYYFYLQYYTLEDGNAPDFREADRLYFLFLMHWERVDWVAGMIRTKKRRQGASSQSCSNLIYEAIFYQNSNCGLISKTKEDSKDTFTEMVTAAYRQLPAFLKPKQVNKEDSVSELVFAYKSQTIKDGSASTIKNDEGHRSKINYRAPVLNAYDRSRMSRVLLDEGAKYPKDVPTSQLLSIIMKTLFKGVKRVGWIDLPSTVNEMTKGGGAEFYAIWKSADQFKRRPTVNRLVRFFQPAYEAYEGYIDQYGDSVVDTPTEEQYNYLVDKWVKRDEITNEVISELSEDDIKLGSKHYVLVKRREGLEGIALEEEIRQNPCTEEEAFLSTVTDCVFNSLKISRQRKYLEEHPAALRKVVFYRKADQTIGWREIAEGDRNFYWSILAFPPNGEENKFKYVNNLRKPERTHDGCIGVDGYSNSQGGRQYGSKASAWIIRKFDIRDPENTGMFIGHLYGRPQVKDQLHEQVMFASELFGYQVAYEHNADDYLSYYRERGRIEYLMRYPLSSIDPVKRKDADRHRGFPTTPFSLTKQVDTMTAYIEDHCDKIYFDELLKTCLQFEPHNRTEYDCVVAAMIALVSSIDIAPPQERRRESLVKVYENTKYKERSNLMVASLVGK